MLELPGLRRLDGARNALLAGAGGGFDVYAAIPLFLALRARGVEVHLASLSFSKLDVPGVRWASEDVARVDADSPGAAYFPEQTLARWLRTKDIDVPIYCFRREGVKPTRRAYAYLQAELGFDTLVLVDGGSDSLMRGDEFGLGTPVEDIVSIAAALALDTPEKLLLSLGFGVDFYHGVCHAEVLRHTAELAREGAYLGALSLVRGMPEVEAYLDLVAYAQQDTPTRPSIVSASIADAIEGHFGNHHSTSRTGGSTLFINPLMGLYWFYALEAVGRRVLYLDRLHDTETWGDVRTAINRFRVELDEIRPWSDIPI